MAKSYQEVLASLRKEDVAIPDYDHIPDEMGPIREVPQPGSYRFRCPASIENCFGDPIEMTVRDAEDNPIMVPDPKDPTRNVPKTVQRIQLAFDRENALIIVQSPAGEYDNEPLNYRISNLERNRWAGKGVKVKVSDMTYLLRAKAPGLKPVGNEEFIKACLAVIPNVEFGADLESQGSCNPSKDAYFAFQGEGGAIIYEPQRLENGTGNQQGCGERIYHKNWPRDTQTHRYLERAECPKCQASVRPFAQLVRFRA